MAAWARPARPLHGAIQLDTITLMDTQRHRALPLAIYSLEGVNARAGSVVVISHGYNENRPATYLRFSALAEHLAVHGFTVLSIQHEAPNDEPLPRTGDLRVERLPNWERGVQNIRFVLDTLRQLRPWLDLDHVHLIGHSNGGDISMLFAERYPEKVVTAISLDNLRMPLPRVNKPRIASLRAMDTTADPGVLPSADEGDSLGIRIIDMPGFKHVDFNDHGTEEQHQRLNRAVLELLQAVD